MMARRSTCSVEIHKVDLIIGRVETRLQGFTATPNRPLWSVFCELLENLKTHFRDETGEIDLNHSDDDDERTKRDATIAIIALGQNE